MAKKTKGTEANSEELAHLVVEGLNKDGFEVKTLGQDEMAVDLKDFVSTGASLLDLAIANRADAGLACSRMTELQGLEGTGKSLIAAHLLTSVQKDGGIGVLLDTEYAVSQEYLQAIGVDISRLIYSNPDTVEGVFDFIVQVIEKIRKHDPKKTKKTVIVVGLRDASADQGRERRRV
jgi:RecA/RadA recombinase